MHEGPILPQLIVAGLDGMFQYHINVIGNIAGTQIHQLIIETGHNKGTSIFGHAHQSWVGVIFNHGGRMLGQVAQFITNNQFEGTSKCQATRFVAFLQEIQKNRETCKRRIQIV